MLLLLGLVVHARACRPTQITTEFTDAFPPEITKLLVLRESFPRIPILADESKSQPEPEGSGEELKDVIMVKQIPMSCASSVKVELLTIYPWDEKKLDEYGIRFERDLQRLQKYSQTAVSSFGNHRTQNVIKIYTSKGLFYGQRFFVEGLDASCMSVKEFIRKAVSWSTTIPKATLTCRCEPEVIIRKV